MPRTITLLFTILLMGFCHLAFAQTKVLQIQISSSSDDAEEKGLNSEDAGTVDLGSSDIELVNDGGDGDQFVGLRFENLSIPKGSLISKAYIQFTVDEDDDQAGTVFIQVEDTDNPVTFTETDNNISSRPVVEDSIVWENIPVWNEIGAAGAEQQTPDLSSLVQTAINRPGWETGNAISFIITGTGERVAESYDGTLSSAAILVVEYKELMTLTFTPQSSEDDVEVNLLNTSIYYNSSDLEFTSDGATPQLIAIRFPKVNIPSGSEIQSAYVQFRVDETNAGGQVDMLASFEATSNAAPITDDTNPLNRDYNDPILWGSLPDWNTVDEAGADQRTPDLTELLQVVIDREDWKGGNAVLFGLVDPVALNVEGFTGNTSKRVAQSYDKDPNQAAKLVVSFFPSDEFQTGSFPISKGASWKYEDSGTDLHSEPWTTIAYNDTTWNFGNAILGYGDDRESTTLSFGDDAENKHPTTYLRHVFEVENAAQYESLIFNTLYDDGVIVYVNGIEAFRLNMPEGEVGYTTFAKEAINGDDEINYTETKVGNLLQDGLNVIAVELHQAGTGSSDLGFDMEVGFTLPPLAPTAFPLEKNSTWHYLDDGTSLDDVAWQDTTYATIDDDWAWGNGVFGYGDPVNTRISFGPDARNKYTTYYFRKELDIDLASLPDTIELGVLRDDGAVIYINGVEVRRDNLPAGPIDYLTTAIETIAGANEEVYYTSRLLASDFRQGINTIAVEVHNRDVFSSDLAFDLYLDAAPEIIIPVLECGADEDDHISCFTSIAPTAQTSNLIIPSSSHRFQQIHKQGSRYSIGEGTVPGNHDFTAYVPIDGSSEVGYLSINHENTPGGVSMLGLHYDPETFLWMVDSSQAVDFYNEVLVTTTRNCSGGITPWGTIITAEETQNNGDANNDGYTDVGWLVEIDPATASVKEYGRGTQEKLWACGRLSHENAAILEDQVTLFTGEDGGSSAVFKFIADTPGDLTAGSLYALKLDGTISGGEPTSALGTWIEIPNTTQEDRNNTRALAISLGATNFNGVEDIEVHPLTGQIYFTSKGNGRTYRFTNAESTVSDFETFVGGQNYLLFTENGVVTEPWGGGNDNLTFDDRGNLWVLQDGGRNYVWVVRPDHTQDNPKVEIFSSMPIGSEPTGLTFSPDYRFGFLSVQHPSGSNTNQLDATGKEVAFNASATIIFSRSGNLGAQIPKSDFTADIQTVAIGELVTFFDRSTNNPTAWEWTFEGGAPDMSTEESPTVVYNELGTYDVSLKTTNEAGEGDLIQKMDYITVTQSTSTDENYKYNLNIFPNPTTGKINVRMDLDGGEMVRFEALDMLGRSLADFGVTQAVQGTDIWTLDLTDKVTAGQMIILKITVDKEVMDRFVQIAQ